MNYKQLVKICVCALVLSTTFVSVCAASVDSEQARYANADEKTFEQMENSFQCQYKQFAGTEDVIVISDSANFENCNSVRHYVNLDNAKIRLIDYKGRTETLSVKDLQNKYECYVFAKAPQTFDNSGSLSANYYAMRD
ncbi:MAG: hypothetical protein PHD20_04725 [Clostridia bacterium]|nr:hypothetical protein [Clostridia bacterium]MDD4720682.1 hypothetical protein [Bacteroides sp.]